MYRKRLTASYIPFKYSFPSSISVGYDQRCRKFAAAAIKYGFNSDIFHVKPIRPSIRPSSHVCKTHREVTQRSNIPLTEPSAGSKWSKRLPQRELGDNRDSQTSCGSQKYHHAATVTTLGLSPQEL